MHAPGSDPRRHTQHQGMRGVREDRRLLGPSAPLPHLRPRRLLRPVEEPPRHGALPYDRPPADPVRRAGGGLALVLRRRVVDGAGMTTSDPWPALPFAEWRDTKETLHMYTQV